jgi:hypothetical protein
MDYPNLSLAKQQHRDPIEHDINQDLNKQDHHNASANLEDKIKEQINDVMNKDFVDMKNHHENGITNIVRANNLVLDPSSKVLTKEDYDNIGLQDHEFAAGGDSS